MIQRIKNTKSEFWLVLILIFALFLRLYFFVGLNWSDDVMYVFDANRVAEGTIGVPHYLPGLRWMMIYPVGLSFKLFSVGQASATLYPLLCSLGSIILIFYLGKLLVNEKAGLIAAFLLSFCPLNVIYATWIMPDVPIAFFIGLSIFLFLKGERTNEKEDVLTVYINKLYKFYHKLFNLLSIEENGRDNKQKNKERVSNSKKIKLKKQSIFYLLSGVMIGLAYLLKVSGLIALIFLIPYLLHKTISKRHIKWGHLIIILGLLFIFFSEGLFYYLQSGDLNDFTLRYRVVSGYYSHDENFLKYIKPNLNFYPQGLLNLDHTNNFNWSNKYFVHYGLFYYFVVISILYLLLTKKKKSYILISWVILFFLYLEFGSMSLTEYIPIHKLYRHLTVLTIPSLLILSYALDLNINSNHKIRKIFSLLLILFLLITSVYYIQYRHIYLKASTYDLWIMHKYLDSQEEKPIYCDSGVAGHLKFYTKFKKNHLFRCLECVKDCSKIKDSFVILKGSRGYADNPYLISKLPECARNPPRGWRLVKTISGPKIDIYGSYDPEIYYVPG